MEFKAVLTKKTEDELDSFLEQNQVSRTAREYRLLKQVIIASYLRPDMTLKAIFEDMSASNGMSPGAIAISVNRLVKRSSKECGKVLTLSEFINLCTNTLYSFSDI